MSNNLSELRGSKSRRKKTRLGKLPRELFGSSREATGLRRALPHDFPSSHEQEQKRHPRHHLPLQPLQVREAYDQQGRIGVWPLQVLQHRRWVVASADGCCGHPSGRGRCRRGSSCGSFGSWGIECGSSITGGLRRSQDHRVGGMRLGLRHHGRSHRRHHKKRRRGSSIGGIGQWRHRGRSATSEVAAVSTVQSPIKKDENGPRGISESVGPTEPDRCRLASPMKHFEP